MATKEEIASLETRIAFLERLVKISFKRWLTTEEAAIYMGCKERTIRHYIKVSKLSARKPLHKLYVDRLEIDELINDSVFKLSVAAGRRAAMQGPVSKPTKKIS